jgi:hypothetical protein
MTALEIKNWYNNYDTSQGLDSLLKYRQHLSLCMYEMSLTIAELEGKSKAKEAERRIQQAIKELDSDEGTAAARKQDAVKQTREILEDEARYEGQLKGYRIQYDALNGISHSMASYINKG